MSKMHVGLAAIALLTAGAPPSSANADAWGTRHRHHARAFQAPVYHYEDSCGCMVMTVEYHRELKYTYGSHMDPRSFDQTEPFYYYGAIKGYPRYWTTRTAQP